MRPFAVGRTLLIGHPGVTWREWLKEHRENADLLVLDPSEPLYGPPARFVLAKGHRPVWQRFYGSLDAQRAPHVLVAALADALPHLGDQTLVQIFPYRPTPLLRQLVQLVHGLLRPDRVLIAEGTALDHAGFDAETVELGASLPPTVQAAQRKAHWLQLLESCEMHEVELANVTVEGTRLGSGTIVTRDLSGALYAERCGSALLAVTDSGSDDAWVGGALDATHTSRAHLFAPDAYDSLLCSFARANGEDFGMGMIREVDWSSRRMRIQCAAVPPAPVKILRLGALRVDENGNEGGEAKGL